MAFDDQVGDRVEQRVAWGEQVGSGSAFGVGEVLVERDPLVLLQDRGGTGAGLAVPVVVGGIVPPADVPRLAAAGVAAKPGTAVATAAEVSAAAGSTPLTRSGGRRPNGKSPAAARRRQ